ncbi:aminoglycoside 6-adenylyltransferase [Microlunatus parietis]|uniref:Putative nucleotidyltransferase n=1 Tax=Microlunatus parietis TaxID=682979 RepID=A0A7Y9IAQ6_9ACTN|nr:aminoglycoside 6-adenylyltransferase [Microlunatus parietis]NYE73466.1 putative nucleotidyltransferase [Microlunatus parietis]
MTYIHAEVELIMSPEEALRPLPEPYHRHFARILEVVESDRRIRGLWLSGSLARGTADAGSDLDLVLAVADEEFDAFVEGWRDWLARITPTLVAKAIPNSKLVFYALAEDICRIDAVIEPVSKVATSGHRTRVAVIDRDGLHATLPAAEPGPGPDLTKINLLIEEFWRIQSIFPAMINDRKDLLCALSGVQASGTMLYDLFVETNQPLPPMGVKQFAARLQPDQSAVLLGLPAVAPERDLLIKADLAVCEAMATAGRAAAERVGAEYPERIASAVRAHHRATLT